PAAADCVYFRTKARVQQCKAARGEPLPPVEADEAAQAVGEALEKDDGKRVKLVCSCEYSLSGSDPLCDFDRQEEIPSLIPADDPKPFCRQAAKRCAEICPRRISDGKSR